MKIINLKGLEDKKELQFDDIVEFTVKEKIIKYIVKYDHLLNKDHKRGKLNNEIFRILKIDKYKIAEKAYGYKQKYGMWPCSKNEDFPALTRLVAELYIIIEKRKIVFTKFTRFEIMEI